jgi:hypothetical protein
MNFKINPMRILITIVFLCSIGITTNYAQDIIITKDKKKIEARIVEINKMEVKYFEYDDPNELIFTMDRALISEIRYEFGRKEKEVNPELNEVYYMEDNPNNLKINFTAIADAVTILTYERSVSPASAYELSLKISGVGVNNETKKSGFGIAGAYKLKIGNLIKKNGSYRPKHLLAGTYFRPNLGINYTKIDENYYYDPNKYLYMNFGLDIGHQWIIQNTISLDFYFGFHYYGGSFDYDAGNDDPYREPYISDGDIFGYNNTATSAGFRVGFLFDGKKERR